MPIGTLLQVEHVAMAAEASPTRFYARLMLLLGIGVSICIQDALCSMPEEKGIEEDQVVSKIKWSKPGHPIWVVAPLEGIHHEWLWGREHAESCIQIGNVFPDFDRAY
eukprot:6174798-Pleurochrysis_carterae.AAC.1